MHVLDGGVVLSASDLTGFAACEHLTQLELAHARGEIDKPDRDDPLLDVLSRLGAEHETGQLDRFRSDGSLRVVEVAMPDNTRVALFAAEAETFAHMQAGVDVIYQATFFDGRWRGHADFLLRVDRPSPVLGGWSYEVADTKLARRVKAAALLQMCNYSDHVERLQGAAPEHMRVIAGDTEQHTYDLRDFAAYYRALKARYETFVDGPPADTYPDPVDHCGICRWVVECKARRRADDHLSLVSGMRRDQTRRFVAAGVDTRRALAALPADTFIPEMAEPTFERLRHQAEIQVRGEGHEPPLYDLLPPERPQPPDPDNAGDPWPERGWAALPEPSPGDLFFDIEGDPYACDGGLEYLFGVIELDAQGEPQYRAFWAHTPEEEKRAFEAVIDLFIAHREQHPDAHVYHYAHYEPSVVKRLMGKHATREREVDELLRGEAFVDLYAVVRQSLRLGLESYSLKEVEHLYMRRPPGAVMDAGSSIVEYEAFLDDGDRARLDEIESYNDDDCRSTLLLRAWLEARRVDAGATFGAIPRPVPKSGEPSEDLDAREAEAEALAAQLVAYDGDNAHARWLLAQMLGWHRREAKADWWAHYARLAMSDDQLFDDRESISGLAFVRELEPVGRSRVFRYAFAPQDHKFKQGDKPLDPSNERGMGEVIAVDDTKGWIDLKRGVTGGVVHHPHALIPGTPAPTRAQEDAIRRVARYVIEHGTEGPGPYQSARDVLLRARRSPADGPFDRSYLAIQGPPGTGKTYTGAELIVDLVEQGKTVGVTAHSHAAIGNLLDKIAELAEKRGVKVRALQKAEEHQECGASIVVEHTKSNERVQDAAASREFDVIAGTAWLWAREQMAGTVDVLFVDEAGQKSLADVIAVSGAADKLVLLGDPQQLAQPSKGSHPEGAEVSALEHILGDEQVMPSNLGWFLDVTWRMHPKVCAFVSEVAYKGELHSKPGLARQSVGGFAGLRWVPVEGVGNRSWSAGEVSAVKELVDEYVGQEWTDEDGNTRPLALDDLLVVAPYNAHVSRLAQALPEGAKVGTVDKFQGQEAPVTIYSMATSSADDVPRSMEFLYDLHRLNVAVSRARAVSIIVCNPELLSVHCRTPDQLRLANALCRFGEIAAVD